MRVRLTIGLVVALLAVDLFVFGLLALATVRLPGGWSVCFGIAAVLFAASVSRYWSRPLPSHLELGKGE